MGFKNIMGNRKFGWLICFRVENMCGFKLIISSVNILVSQQAMTYPALFFKRLMHNFMAITKLLTWDIPSIPYVIFPATQLSTLILKILN